MNDSDCTKLIATGFSMSPALCAHLDEVQSHFDDEKEESDCPVLREAGHLSSFFLCSGDDDQARSIDGNPWNGVNHEQIRTEALSILRIVDRYLAARKARFRVEADQWVSKEVIDAERAKLGAEGVGNDDD
jgi:hypothetical protein